MSDLADLLSQLNASLSDHIGLLPMLLLTILALLLLPLSQVRSFQRGLGVFALLGLGVATALVYEMFAFPHLGFGTFERRLDESYFGGAMVVNAWSLFFSAIFLVVALLVCLASLSEVKRHEPHQGEYYALLLLATVGMLVVASANDLFLLFIGIEIASVSTFALTAWRKKDALSSEAAIKFFLIGGLSAALLLYGISWVYGATGSVQLGQIATAAPHTTHPEALTLGALLMIAGFGFKFAAVPFHGWAPDVYTGAPTTISAFLAAGSKKMAVVAALKVFVIGFGTVAATVHWQLIFGVLAILTMTVGNVVALWQTDIKRMLAYSSIGQAGYILIAVAVATPDAIAAGLYHSLTHALMKGGAFLLVGGLAAAGVGYKIADWEGLGRRSPGMALAATLLLLGLAGIPPTGGFFSKFFIFATAVAAGDWFLWLAVIGLLNSALSLYYYAKVIRAIYKRPAKAGAKHVHVPLPYAAAVILATIGVLATFFFANLGFGLASEAAESLLTLTSLR